MSSPTASVITRAQLEADIRRLGGTVAQRRSHFLDRLLRTRRFPEGWWHADDIESAIDVMRARLDELALPTEFLSEALVESAGGGVPAEDDGSDAAEDTLRRHQIGRVARRLNEVLAATSDARRLFAFDEATCSAESDEPAWMLLTAEERVALLEADVLVALRGGTVESAYDP